MNPTELETIRENLLIARRLVWVSTIHRDYLDALEDQARINNLKV